EKWHAVMRLNLDGVYHVLSAVGRRMLERGRGSIINTGSMSGIIANIPQTQASYNASKAAVHNLTRSAALEWAERGVRVNAIAPGYMRTELTRGFYEAGGPQIDQWNLMTPMGRPGEPRDRPATAVTRPSAHSSSAPVPLLPPAAGNTAASPPAPPLPPPPPPTTRRTRRLRDESAVTYLFDDPPTFTADAVEGLVAAHPEEIGRASCRERV